MVRQGHLFVFNTRSIRDLPEFFCKSGDNSRPIFANCCVVALANSIDHKGYKESTSSLLITFGLLSQMHCAVHYQTTI
jgi:hypothetical protein